MLGLFLRVKFHSPVYFEDFWMDSPSTKDPALSNPDMLISNRIPSPSVQQKDQPVYVLVHGFSASTFEFDIFKQTVLAQDETVLFSSVLLGGHGRDHEAFKQARYSDWFDPVKKEVHLLTLLGYKNIILFGVSTGATGILHLLLNGDFKNSHLSKVYLMDPYIVPKNSNLYLVPYLKYMIRNTRSTASQPLSYANWYVNRPANALSELLKLVKTINVQLSRFSQEFSIPDITVFTAANDPTSATEGADVILSSLGSEHVNLIRYDSDRHVIIESQTKLDWSEQDQRHFNHVLQTMFPGLKFNLN